MKKRLRRQIPMPSYDPERVSRREENAGAPCVKAKTVANADLFARYACCA